MSIYIHLINLIENSGPLEIPESREPWQRDYDRLVAAKELVIAKVNGVDAYCLPQDKKPTSVKSLTLRSAKKKTVHPVSMVKSMIKNVIVVMDKLPKASNKLRSASTKGPIKKVRSVSAGKVKQKPRAS